MNTETTATSLSVSTSDDFCLKKYRPTAGSEQGGEFAPTMDRRDSFICSHVVDRSLLKQGFTLPAQMLYDFKSWFGPLDRGASQEITIRFEGFSYPVRLGNRNFDRSKWPTHREMYQIRYNPSSAFAKALQSKFSVTKNYIAATLLKNPNLGKKHIDIPDGKREQIVFYRTDDPLVWESEVQTAAETQMVSEAIKTIDETLFESTSWIDKSAGLVVRPAIIKVRRLDRAIGNNLKRVYKHRCQICGEQVAAHYDVHVDEVHHIEPFVTSLNNDVTNLIVLCPNHHRIVHATHAVFLRSKLSFQYPNGLEEKLSLNYHI